ncbi:MAG: glycerophosphodiester phosphodiesterase family protein [Arenibacter latericius]|nr:glycerophosphodiester phosphodiesterase family protein [Arenibacter latericius]
MITLILVLLLFVYPTFISAQDALGSKANYDMPDKGICAHRGASETHPENTLAAFEEAIRLGAQMIEFDVQLTKDKVLVIMHDETVNRTTNGWGRVGNLTLKEIKHLDAGKWKSEEFEGEKVPTLKEVLHIMPKDIWLNIHLKGDELLGYATAEVVIAANRIHQAIIACEKGAANGVRQVSPKIMICNMERMSSRTEYIDQTIEKGFAFIQLKNNRDDINMYTDIKRLKDNRVYINYYHSEEVAKVKELLDLGVNFILTDRLSRMLKAFNELN